MKIFKFGGASVKDARGVRNVCNILQRIGVNDTIVVISAMGKTTNAFEEFLHAFINQGDYQRILQKIQEYHVLIVNELFDENNVITADLNETFQEIQHFLDTTPSRHYDYLYDQIIGYGELLSTRIVSAYLNSKKVENTWLDIRKYIKTNTSYREAIVDWELTCHNLKQLDGKTLYITQGFIASGIDNSTTTLGREGSDYTGAILAYCLNAESLTIWKDVAGVLNADPRYFESTVKLDQISYEEAIELAYFGASVIHPKTVQPLQRKQIPLYVKSFEAPDESGTCIKIGDFLLPETACFIVKKNQIVLQISTRDFAFIDEEVIRDVFDKLSVHQLKVNLMQISAISLSLCVGDKFNTIETAIDSFKDKFDVQVINGCALYTIRHYSEGIERIIPNASSSIIRQSGKNTLQLVIKEANESRK